MPVEIPAPSAAQIVNQSQLPVDRDMIVFLPPDPEKMARVATYLENSADRAHLAFRLATNEHPEAAFTCITGRLFDEWCGIESAFGLMAWLLSPTPFVGTFAYSYRCVLCRDNTPHTEEQHMILSTGMRTVIQ
jgi:hypothetical protein